MFKLSSRAGSVSFDGAQIIQRADQTVDVIGNVTQRLPAGLCVVGAVKLQSVQTCDIMNFQKSWNLTHRWSERK